MGDSLSKTEEFYRRAKERIPGGTQLLSKRPEMMAPELARVARQGKKVMNLWAEHGRQYGQPIVVGGCPCLAHFRF